MKKVFTNTIIICISVILLPVLLTLLFSIKVSNKAYIEAMNYKIYNETEGKKENLDLNQYLIGVVAANMPAGYHMEALKAQAVIARTYVLYNLSLLAKDSNKKRFNTSDLGLSFISLSDLKQYWGEEDYSSYFTKIENSVYGTKDEVLTYDGKVILPVFFDTSCGYTRTAKEAWGVDIPYLVSVPSKQDVTSIHYLNISEFEVPEFIELLNKKYPDLEITKDNIFKKLKVTNRDSNDYAIKVDLGNQTVTGEEFAKAVGLNSSHFYIEEYEGKIRIICNGVGHGVGFSQYGANAMAEDGYTYKELLTHYYTGVDIIKTDGKD